MSRLSWSRTQWEVRASHCRCSLDEDLLTASESVSVHTAITELFLSWQWLSSRSVAIIRNMLATCAGLAGLQAAIQRPDRIRGVQLTNISLRMLHASKQSRFQRPAVAMVQRVLRETNVGQVCYHCDPH